MFGPPLEISTKANAAGYVAGMRFTCWQANYTTCWTAREDYPSNNTDTIRNTKGDTCASSLVAFQMLVEPIYYVPQALYAQGGLAGAGDVVTAGGEAYHLYIALQDFEGCVHLVALLYVGAQVVFGMGDE